MKNLIFKIINCVLFLFCISFIISPKTFAATIFSDDFTNTNGTSLTTHNNNWVILDGSAQIQNNTLYTQTGTHTNLPISLTDQCASFDFQAPLVGRKELYLRAKDTPTQYFQNGYYFLIDHPENYQANFHMADNFGWLNNEVSLNNLSSGWHNFKACAIGTQLTAYIDNNMIANATARNNFTEGYARIGLSQGNFIDNFIYSDPNSSGISLPVPLLKQTSNPWQSQEYDTAHLWNPTNPTINRWGCAMTSAAMVFQYHGIKKLPDGTMLDPGTLNTWLKNQPDGYVGQGWTNWLALSRLSKLAKNINGISSFDALEYSRLGNATAYQTKKDQLTNDINNELPGILEVPGHFIVGKGIEGDTFSINDPYYNRTTLNQGYSNTFISLGRFVPSLTDLSYIMIIGDSDTNFKLKDQNGNVIAESSEQQPIIDPENPNNQNKPISILYAPKPTTGNYELITSGNTEKINTISTYFYDINGNPYIIETTNLGNNSYKLSFNKNYNNQSTVNKKVTFESVIEDIKTLDKNKSINHGLANSLIALVTTAQKQYEKEHAKEANSILNQAINLLNISKQNEKLISEEAYKLLSIDLEALNKLINN